MPPPTHRPAADHHDYNSGTENVLKAGEPVLKAGEPPPNVLIYVGVTVVVIVVIVIAFGCRLSGALATLIGTGSFGCCPVDSLCCCCPSGGFGCC
jgi:hypothetical protein